MAVLRGPVERRVGVHHPLGDGVLVGVDEVSEVHFCLLPLEECFGLVGQKARPRRPSWEPTEPRGCGLGEPSGLIRLCSIRDGPASGFGGPGFVVAAALDVVGPWRGGDYPPDDVVHRGSLRGRFSGADGPAAPGAGVNALCIFAMCDPNDLVSSLASPPSGHRRGAALPAGRPPWRGGHQRAELRDSGAALGEDAGHHSGLPLRGRLPQVRGVAHQIQSGSRAGQEHCDWPARYDDRQAMPERFWGQKESALSGGVLSLQRAKPNRTNSDGRSGAPSPV